MSEATFSMTRATALDPEAGCPRAHWYEKYHAQGGYRYPVTDTRRQAFILKSVSNQYSLLGDIVHALAAEALQDGDITPENVRGWMLEEGRKRVAQAIADSKGRGWIDDPKHVTHLIEHDQGRDVKASAIISKLNLHVRNMTARDEAWEGGRNLFFDHLRNRERIEIVERLIRWDGLDMPMWLSPDVLAAHGDVACIDDWKTGRQKDAHADQLDGYAAWAGKALGYRRVILRLIYTGETPVRVVRREIDPDEAFRRLQSQVSDFQQQLAGYLVDGDVARNEPKPMDAWPTNPGSRCRWCSFAGMCKDAQDGN